MCPDDESRERLLAGPLKPQGLFLNEVQGFMAEADKTAAGWRMLAE